MPTPNTLPSDANGYVYEGVNIPNTGPAAKMGKATYMTTGTDNVPTSPEVVFMAGVKSAQVPTNASGLTSNATTTITFTNPYDRIMLQNNSTATIYYAFDTTASLGMFQLFPTAMIFLETSSVLEIYQNSGAVIPINAAGGVTIQVW